MDVTPIEKYYSSKISEFGATSKGVDWKNEESQILRFKQLLRNFCINEQSSFFDFGCGYGAILKYLYNNYKFNRYTGYDISELMLAEAEKRHPGSESIQWINKFPEEESFDFSILSGIFNVRLEETDLIWRKYIVETLEKVNKISREGFSFNILTSYSDPEFKRDYLYYADPQFFFDYCKKNFSKYVTLNHDYDLYEFTISVVRKPNG